MAINKIKLAIFSVYALIIGMITLGLKLAILTNSGDILFIHLAQILILFGAAMGLSFTLLVGIITVDQRHRKRSTTWIYKR